MLNNSTDIKKLIIIPEHIIWAEKIIFGKIYQNKKENFKKTIISYQTPIYYLLPATGKGFKMNNNKLIKIISGL